MSDQKNKTNDTILLLWIFLFFIQEKIPGNWLFCSVPGKHWQLCLQWHAPPSIYFYCKPMRWNKTTPLLSTSSHYTFLQYLNALLV